MAERPREGRRRGGNPPRRGLVGPVFTHREDNRAARVASFETAVGSYIYNAKIRRAPPKILENLRTGLIASLRDIAKTHPLNSSQRAIIERVRKALIDDHHDELEQCLTQTHNLIPRP